VTTGAEVLTVVFWDENFHHFATEGLEPMINQDAGRKLLIKMMTPKEKVENQVIKLFQTKIPPSVLTLTLADLDLQLKPGQVPPPPPEPVPDPVVDPVFPEVDTDSSEFIENVDEREKAFKDQVKWIVKEVRKLRQSITQFLTLSITFRQRICRTINDLRRMPRFLS
jgi:hypothetical protein